jgi:hypothetical protein
MRILNWQRLKAKWTLAAVAASGVISSALLPADAFKDVTQELIALFGLMMAGVLPAMVLTASVLRADNMSVKKLIEYRDALRRQMTFWIGLFLISLVASLFVIVGKMAGWSIDVRIPLSSLRLIDVEFDAIRIVNMLITMSLAVVVLRVIAVGNGVISLLRLSAELAISEAQARDEVRHRQAEEAIRNMPERKGFADYVDLPLT